MSSRKLEVGPATPLHYKSSRQKPRLATEHASALQSVEAGISKIRTAIVAFDRLVNSLGSLKDTAELRDKLHKTRLDIEQLVKESLAKLREAREVVQDAETLKKSVDEKLAAGRETTNSSSVPKEVRPSSYDVHVLEEKVTKKRVEGDEMRVEAAALGAKAGRQSNSGDKEAGKSLKIPDKKANRVEILVPKVTESELHKQRVEQQAPTLKVAKKAKEKQCRTAAGEKYERMMLESTSKGCSNDKTGCYTLFIDNLPENIHWKRKSLTGVLRKSGMEDVSRKNHYKVEGVIDEEKLQVLSNCLVGWCKDFVKIGHLARQMQAKGLIGFTLMRAAGNAILMIFEDNASLRSVKNDKSKILAEWFSIVEAWLESLVMEYRRVWLVCEGVPFHAWNWDTFKNIADKWGLLLAINESCQYPSSFNRAKIQVLTKAYARIDAMVELKVADNFFKVMVHEIEPSFKPNSWAPEEDESH
ncbi:Syntaxin of plants 21 isoform 2 [Hibiscus syriacus]|uniref:Syntaxin of plants 21 isoform 2 n=1 Tax=Hibiscus syriacus TaxID=106335 RepID=A0A6A2XI24_HIBSY|nr:Syntaxin of plants 21 isoform 2 [Hibiscus syriacus]